MAGNRDNSTIVISIAALLLSAYSAYVAQRAVDSSERISLETQRSTLFSQFQEQYNSISTRFPRSVLDQSFRPKRGSDDYVRMEAYWFFCFSEWYATNRVNRPAIGDLWVNYYTPLISDALEIPSLRYVLEERIRSRGIGRGQWTLYLKELARIARANGTPLSPDVEARLKPS